MIGGQGGGAICARTLKEICSNIYGIMRHCAGLCAQMNTRNKKKTFTKKQLCQKNTLSIWVTLITLQ